MGGDANKFRHLVDAGLGSVSATVATLPIGYTIGEARVVDQVEYNLVFNSGNSAIPPGYVAIQQGSGYSVTISSAVEVNDHIGAVVANTVSVPTANYFWGAKRGYLASGLVASAVCIVTGAQMYIGTNGNVISMPLSLITGVTPIGNVLVTVLSTTSGGGRNGGVYINLP